MAGARPSIDPDVDDRAAVAAADHVLRRRARHRRDAGHVDAQHLAHVVRLQIEQRRHRLDAGVVHHRVDAAERRYHVGAQTLGVAFDVAVHHAGACAQFAGEHLRGDALLGVVHGNARPRGVQTARDAGADAAAGAGDEHDAFAQIEQGGNFGCDHDGTVPFDRSSVLWNPRCAR